MPYPDSGDVAAADSDSIAADSAFWFAFDVGAVHVVSASSEHPYEESSKQHRWLKQELAKSQRMKEQNGTWIVFAIHRPLYSSDMSDLHDHLPGSRMIRALEPLLLDAKVDLILTGHQHGYERIHPNVNGTVTDRTDVDNAYIRPRGPVHLLVGSAGAMQNERWLSPKPSWSAKRFAFGPEVSRRMLDSYGFVRVDVAAFQVIFASGDIEFASMRPKQKGCSIVSLTQIGCVSVRSPRSTADGPACR